MQRAWRRIAGPVFSSAFFCSAIFITGCSVNSIATKAPVANPNPTGAISGRLHGGRQPIAGAEIFLLGVNLSGAGYSQPATSLLVPTTNTHQDITNGAAWNGWYYVPTRADGTFTIKVADWGANCTPGTQALLFSYSGVTLQNGSNNPSATLLSVLGDCANFGNLPSQVQINEVTTVAAAYALSGFAPPTVTDPVHFSAPNDTQPTRNVINAISSFFNLVNLGSGNALVTTPAGNGAVPTDEINILADILAACVNLVNGTGSCTTLFNNALNSSAVAPTDTATAALNIARNPGNTTANTNLYGLVTAAGSKPYPYSGGQPNDFTMGITYNASSLNGPQDLAIDANGYVWITNNNQCNPDTDPSPIYCITALAPNGKDLAGTNGFRGGNLSKPSGIAIDPSGDLWIANSGSNNGATASLTEMVPSVNLLTNTATITGATGFTNPALAAPWGLALDSQSNVWITDRDGSQLSEFSGGAFVYTSGSGANGPDGGLDDPSGIAIDVNNNIWIANAGGLNNNTVSLFVPNTPGPGATPDASSPLTAGSAPEKPAIDPSGDVWVSNYGGPTGSDSSVWELKPTDLPPLAFHPENKFTGGGITGPYGSAYGLAIDSGGNIWSANYGPIPGADENPTPGSISELSGYNSGSAESPANGFQPGLNKPIAIAIDGSGNVWVVINGNSTILELVGAAFPVATPMSSQDTAGEPF